jgi:uncharacterized protein YndB with AHSA1/START domain
VGGEERGGPALTTGLTRDAGWQIGVSRTFPCDPDHAWGVLTANEGLARWLGLVDGLPEERGEPYRTADGTTGELRSFRPADRIRLTWRPPGWDHDSTVQVALSVPRSKQPDRPRTVVRFHQERLAGPDEREAMRAHWASVLDALTPLLVGECGT